ncbi:UNVERIFIED_CONTAM: putative late blight resistance proteinR1B-19 [Sesamum radiatum]|uniref:Late blight resistance proteinR1B-19 n=1 Tax=Sesamum radiatum TaxID=300843 RepID=A0AAW2PMT6_SESRA
MSDISLEETAENYLENLIGRNLLRVDKRRYDGRVKTCRIHDMLRDFCKKEARIEKDNFLKEVKRDNEGVIEPSIDGIKKVCRLCIHSDVLKFLFARPASDHIRSFVSFSKKKITLEAQDTLTIALGFKLLRVL